MESLFNIGPSFPSGFSYVDDFISQGEEATLIDAIRQTTLHTFIFQGFEAKRKVASFGYDYSFDKRTLTKGVDIPAEYDWLIRRVAEHTHIHPADFSELLLTEYPIGAVINWHRDAFPFRVITGISLNTDCIFRLRPHQKEKQGRKSLLSFPVKRRSLYIMKDEARYNWEHSTAPVGEIRYSITLRTLHDNGGSGYSG